ncbi:MAG: hypothetical protein Q7T50_05075 [Candidatus Magasanikbacteria bacterium]|nr:hypothetical protein [Candidatus Magasanikbacteria bacterium]
MKKIALLVSLISVLFSLSFSTAHAESTVTYPGNNSDLRSRMLEEFYLIKEGIRKLTAEKETIIQEMKADEEKNKNFYAIRETQKNLYIAMLKKMIIGAEDFIALKKCAKIIKEIETLSEKPIIIVIKTFTRLDNKNSLHRSFAKAERTMDQLIKNGLKDYLFEINIFDDFSKNGIVEIQTKNDEMAEEPCDPRLERIKIIESNLKKLENAAKQREEGIAFRLETLE